MKKKLLKVWMNEEDDKIGILIMIVVDSVARLSLRVATALSESHDRTFVKEW